MDFLFFALLPWILRSYLENSLLIINVHTKFLYIIWKNKAAIHFDSVTKKMSFLHLEHQKHSSLSQLCMRPSEGAYLQVPVKFLRDRSSWHLFCAQYWRGIEGCMQEPVPACVERYLGRLDCSRKSRQSFCSSARCLFWVLFLEIGKTEFASMM